MVSALDLDATLPTFLSGAYSLVCVCVSIIYFWSNIAKFMTRTLIKRHANLANKFYILSPLVGISEFTARHITVGSIPTQFIHIIFFYIIRIHVRTYRM